MKYSDDLNTNLSYDCNDGINDSVEFERKKH